MEKLHGEKSDDLFRAQSKLYHHIFNFINSMSLKCAVQLGIPDAIHSHKKPITLPELAATLGIHPSKTASLGRLMQALVHSGIFATTEVAESQKAYMLTPSSMLLIKDNLTCLSPLVLSMLDAVFIEPWHSLAGWFTRTSTSGNCPNTPFEAAHGVDMWGLLSQDPAINNLFNQNMASDSKIINSVIGECREVFEGLESVVDVGGGTGTMARIIIGAFPGLKCTVLDLPHVVEGLEDCESLKLVGGDMFEAIPSADAVLLKRVLHDWSDEDCVKILKKCKEAIEGRNGNEKGKLIVIEIVINDKDDEVLTNTKHNFDLLMMTLLGGRERTEKEWEKIFMDAGFNHYKISPIFGIRSLIEVYP